MSDKPIYEDLPDEIAEKILRIFPDFGGGYLWDLNGCFLGVDDVGGSAEFHKRFDAWVTCWDHCTSTKTFVTDTATLAAEKFDEQGLALATELKRLVGDKSKVVYRFILKEGTVEVLADGSTRDWPPGTNFDANRKWVLDEQTPRKLV